MKMLHIFGCRLKARMDDIKDRKRGWVEMWGSTVPWAGYPGCLGYQCPGLGGAGP